MFTKSLSYDRSKDGGLRCLLNHLVMIQAKELQILEQKKKILKKLITSKENKNDVEPEEVKYNMEKP